MSRIGKKPISVPEGVTVNIGPKNLVEVKGGKGALSQQVDPRLKVTVGEEGVVFERPAETPEHRAMHGLYRSLVQNMVTGVSEGYKKELELVGVGYKAAVQGDVLELSLGFSHGIFFQMPAEIKVSAETAKGKNPRILLEGIDKQLIGEVAAKIRSFRKPEPYKGKGIRFVGEQIRRKAGKTAAK